MDRASLPSLPLIEAEVEARGVKRGTDAFGVLVRAEQVRACQELRGLPACLACPHAMFCSLLAAHRADADAVAFLRRQAGRQP